MIIGSISSSGLLPLQRLFQLLGTEFRRIAEPEHFPARIEQNAVRDELRSVGGERLVFVVHRDGERISFSVHYALDLIFRFAADDDYVQFFAVIPREVVHGGQALHTQVAAREKELDQRGLSALQLVLADQKLHRF